MISDVSEVSVAGEALWSCLSGMEMRATYQGSSASVGSERLRLLTGPGRSLGMATLAPSRDTVGVRFWCQQEDYSTMPLTNGGIDTEPTAAARCRFKFTHVLLWFSMTV